ncbi:MAG: hypothetical protein KJ624_07375 [Chloroflexi bacterium]|nr:hypothetical protein [Chloroflexota bacterium]
MLATSMKMAVEGILSSREARKSALQSMKEDGQTALKGYREALAAEGAHQRGAWLALRSALRAGRARLRAEVQHGSLALMRADLTQARMEWQRTAHAAPTAGPSVKREYVPPSGKAHQQRGKRQA